jgi:transcriptional regulator with XRE-family HTH domain
VSGSRPKGKARNPNVLAEGPAAFRVELGERMRWLLDRFDSRAQAAEVAGVTPEHLASYIAGRAKPPFELVARLAQARGASLDWIARGEGLREQGASITEGFAILPVFEAEASSGHGRYATDEEPRDQVAFSRAWLNAAIRAPEDKLRVVFNRGAANEPDLRDGDAMLVDTGFDRIVDDAFYVFERDGRLADGNVRRRAHRAQDPQSGVRRADPVAGRGRSVAGVRPRALARRIAVSRAQIAHLWRVTTDSKIGRCHRR